MNKKILQMLVGTAVLVGCYSSVMAAEVGLVSSNVKAYVSPDEQAETALYLYEGEEVGINQEVDGYYEAVVEGEVVYIEKDYIVVDSEEEDLESIAPTIIPEVEVEQENIEEIVEEVTPVEEILLGEEVVAYAKQFLGTPYVSGGNNLKTGVDCSGFTQQVYKNFGINLQRSSKAQYASNGYAVSKGELKPGDLVFYGYSSVTHVAIYMGNNQVIHSPVPGKSVSIAPLWQRGDAPIMGYKRMF